MPNHPNFPRIPEGVVEQLLEAELPTLDTSGIDEKLLDAGTAFLDSIRAVITAAGPDANSFEVISRLIVGFYASRVYHATIASGKKHSHGADHMMLGIQTAFCTEIQKQFDTAYAYGLHRTNRFYYRDAKEKSPETTKPD